MAQRTSRGEDVRSFSRFSDQACGLVHLTSPAHQTPLAPFRSFAQRPAGERIQLRLGRTVDSTGWQEEQVELVCTAMSRGSTRDIAPTTMSTASSRSASPGAGSASLSGLPRPKSLQALSSPFGYHHHHLFTDPRKSSSASLEGLARPKKVSGPDSPSGFLFTDC